MPKRLLFVLIVLLLLIPVCVFASGKTEPKTEEPAAAAKSGEPQCGGTLNMITAVSRVEPPSPDVWDSNYFSLRWLDFAADRPIAGDITRGPKGTNEYAFQVDTYVPQEYWVGQMIKSWEITPEKLI